jgi:hypothetical protein
MSNRRIQNYQQFLRSANRDSPPSQSDDDDQSQQGYESDNERGDSSRLSLNSDDETVVERFSNNFDEDNDTTVVDQLTPREESSSDGEDERTGGRRKKTRRVRVRARTSLKKKSPCKMTRKQRKFPRRIRMYSNPKQAQHMAYKYLGKTAKLYPARNPAKKYSICDRKNGKWVNFGQMGYEDYTKHRNKTRRHNYLTRTKFMRGDWKTNRYSANNLSRNVLW